MNSKKSLKSIKINIIGAGISGLIAAKTLEEVGYSPQIFERSDRAGGRLKTDTMGQEPYDHGFQVLLEAYPMAQKHLDYKALDLQAFLPGSVVFQNKKIRLFGDPLRHLGFLIPIILSPLGTLSDKLKVLRLNLKLKNTSIQEIFEKEEQTTLSYLQQAGFSTTIVANFFTPFFSGIFLETDLKTSSRMFEFVFKMFAEGKASVPKKGIEAISQQLVNRLKKTKIHYNTAVKKVDEQGIHIDGLPLIESDYTIIAAQADHLVNGLKDQEIKWKSCYCFYFETQEDPIKKPIIGLIPGGHLINNLHFVNQLTNSKTYTLSVTVVDAQGLSEEALIKGVQEELKTLCGIQLSKLKKTYHIPKALPHLSNIQNEIDATETQLTESIFLAGDLLLNGSLNAAMRSGELAAEAILEKIMS